MAAATSTVFALPELTEMILLAGTDFTVGELLHYRRVCTTWRNTIDSSLHLRQRANLASLPPTTQPTTVCNTLPPSISEVECKPSMDGETTQTQCLLTAELHPNSMHASHTAQLSNILLLQPAHKWKRIAIYLLHADRHKGAHDLCWFWRSDDVRSQGAVTLGSVMDAAQQALATHDADCTQCCACCTPSGPLLLLSYVQPVQDTKDVQIGGKLEVGKVELDVPRSLFEYTVSRPPRALE